MFFPKSVLFASYILYEFKINYNIFSLLLYSYFRLGGPDPLDYISMYSNNGDHDRNIPPHWHYITFGFSDLHGDDRVHS